MICFLEGIVAAKEPTQVVINVGGVGYTVLIPLSSYDRLPLVGEKIHIATCLHIREDAHQLFGFMTEAERSLFQLLWSVTGIGPKLALSALSGMAVRDIKAAIVQGDVKRLSSISGIGKKTAERIVVELRDKLSAGDALEAVAGAEPLSPGDLKMRDAIVALVALGHKQADAQKMVRAAAESLPAEAPLEELIRKALAGR